jgi:hypothetical protein
MRIIRPILEDHALLHLGTCRYGWVEMQGDNSQAAYVDNAGISSVIPKIISVVPLKLFNNFGLEK